MFKFSSVQGVRGPTLARYNGVPWATEEGDNERWVRLALGRHSERIVGVVVRGSPAPDICVSFRARDSAVVDDQWVSPTEISGARGVPFKSDGSDEVVYMFPEPIKAKVVTIFNCGPPGATLRFDLLGPTLGVDAVANTCKLLGVTPKDVTSASSSRNGRGPAEACQLSDHGWVPVADQESPFWQFDARSVTTFTGCRIVQVDSVRGGVAACLGAWL